MKESLLILALIFAQQTNAAPGQNLEAIKLAIVDYLSSQISDKRDHEIVVAPIDPRLRLPKCTKPLEISVHRGRIKPGRNSIGVRCKGKETWNIFHSAAIKIFKDILVLKRSVRRGEIITPQHLTIEKKEISRFRENYFTDPRQVINKQATKNLSAGKIISDKYFTEATLIKRGQKITIASRSPSFSIQMSGQAMKNGIKGQRIPVKNENSRRIIEATVIKPGLVSVDF
jgi:flagella basal body P-ring formation protein FlgA